jgi:Holliday junction resolvase
MPNKNYIKGRNFEYRIKKMYEKDGYLVFRTAGSHSPADLIAFPFPGTKKPILIQCKASDKQTSTKEISVLKHTAYSYNLRAVLITKIGPGIRLLWVEGNEKESRKN